MFDEKDVESQNKTDSYTLWSNELVPDADITGEVWITNQTLIPKEVKYFSVESFDSKKVVQLAFDEWEEFEEEFHISEAFPDRRDISLDAFAELTGETDVEQLTVFSNFKVRFYKEEELLFTENFNDMFETNYFVNLSKEFPYTNFRRFDDSTMRSKIRKFVYNTFYDFITDGIKFFYRMPIIRKEGFLELFTENYP